MRIRENAAVPWMLAMCYETGHREIILRFRRYIGRLSQRLVPVVPYPNPPGIQTIIDHLAKTRPEAKGLKATDFIDAVNLEGNRRQWIREAFI